MSYVIKGPDGNPILREDKEVLGRDLVQVIKTVDLEKRTLSIIGTDETVDRDGDIVSVKGWMIDNYLKNPVFLWAHDYRSVPLARAEKLTLRKKPTPALIWNLQFPHKSLYPFADLILDLYHGKFINASSVGFIPYESEELTEEELAGLPERMRVFGGRRFLKQELLELSGCPVPSNPSALQNAVKQMGVDWAEPTKVFDYIVGKMPDVDFNKEFEKVQNDLSEVECTYEEESETVQVQVPVQVTNDTGSPVEVVPVEEPEKAEEPVVLEPEIVLSPETSEGEVEQSEEEILAHRLEVYQGQFPEIADGTKDSVLRWYQIVDGKLLLIREEVHDSEDLKAFEKLGAVLSRKNKDRLVNAKKLLDEVLAESITDDSSTPVEETQSEPESLTEENIKTFEEIVKEFQKLSDMLKQLSSGG